jgi:DNA-directed RNA polymerase specialized sigma24 family protein
MSVSSGVRHLPLPELTRFCGEETKKFRRGETSDNSACYEMFRRAIRDGDQLAWSRILEQYRGIVLAWVHRHPGSRVVAEDDDHWVDLAFTRLFRAVGPEKLDRFSDVPQILRYLQMCVGSVLQDALRDHRQRLATVSIDVDERDDSDEPPAALQIKSRTVVDRSLDARELWAAVEKALPDDDERRIAYLTLVLEYKPSEIHALYPDRFPSVTRIYPLLRGVLGRLQQNPEIREFLH